MTSELSVTGPSSRRPSRLAHSVTQPLLEQIIRGDLAVGSGLPREVDLEKIFGVSRTVVREAVKSLEQKGVVRARQGLGTTVSPMDEWHLMDPEVLTLSVKYDHDLELQEQLVEVRLALEGSMVAQAASRATGNDLLGLQDLLHQMSTELSEPSAYLETDFRYHLYIMRMSGNRLARNIVQTVHAQVRALRLLHHPTQDELAQTHREHTAIYRALQQNPEAARIAITQHISASWARRRQQIEDGRISAASD
jgi:DNA-binding FadR family transcriptional regulator